MLCILCFFSLHSERFLIVFCFNSLLVGNVLDFCFCLCFCSCTSNVLGYTHKLSVTLARLIKFNRTNINTRNSNTKGFLKSLSNVVFNYIVNLSSLTLNLNQWNVVCGWSIGNHIFNIANNGISNLLLEIFKTKAGQPMQFHKFSVIAYLETDCASDRSRNTEILKARVVHIKERNSEFYLNNLSKVYEIDFCLEWCASLVCKSYNTCKHREVRSFNDLVKGANNKDLHCAVLLLVHKNSDLAIFYSQRRTPTNGVLTNSFAKLNTRRMPLPY